MKAFKEIAKNPSIKGPILILILTLPISVGVECIHTSKLFLEVQTPEKDAWAEVQSFLWSSNGALIYDATDCIVGNSCISSSINESTILMKLMELDSVNCSEGENSRLSFSSKIIGEVPSSAIINLYSGDSNSSGFKLDILPFLNNTNMWINITLDLLSEDWIETSSANWGNITGIEFQLSWSDLGDYIVKIDGLFFGKFESPYSIYGVDIIIWLSLFNSVISFLLAWLILSGLILLILRSFYTWSGTFRYLMGYIGYVYAAFLVFLGITAIVSLSFPPLYIPASANSQEYLNVMQVYQTSWVTQGLIVQLVYYGWVTILCAISLKELVEFSWSKAILASFGAFIMSVLFSSFLLNALF